MSQEIIIDFDEQGEPTVAVKGVKGASCKTLTATLETVLGKTVATETTEEFKERDLNRATERATNRR